MKLAPRALLTLTVLLSSPTAFATDDARAAEAREYYEAGRKAQNTLEAYALFKKAWDLVPDYRTAANLALAEASMDRWVEVAEHLAYWKRNAPEEDRADADLNALLAKALEKVATLELRVTPSTAKIEVDARILDEEATRAPLYFEAKDVRIAISASGYRSYHETLTLTAGSAKTVDVTLDPESSEPAAAPREEGSWKWPVVIGTGALGLAGLGVGVGFLVDSNGKADEARALGSDSCVSPGARCDEYLGLAGASKDSQTISTIGFVAGGAFVAAATLTYFLWSDEDEGRAVRASVSVDPRSGAPLLTFGGKF